MAPALEKPGEAWRSSETCPSAAAWTLEGTRRLASAAKAQALL
ncbi:hypothetical protein PRBEI_2001204600 [Prionailurus iriomotensis]